MAPHAWSGTRPDLMGLPSDMASLMARWLPNNRPPVAATPEKCGIEKTFSGFRTWRRSVEMSLRLATWPDKKAMLHIRLVCVSELRCTLDARFHTEQWEALEPRLPKNFIRGDNISKSDSILHRMEKAAGRLG
ncbi:hypothetical protein E2C01_029376 [Portunus trituberculatus]|uniref:Uncharacterized protein n=1 Tax=Portunus trituberculatus TaxID=210409 RepID=A0A5B7ERP0_PORTR|nr:hypothetical protein [Portunus trituberculatus]